MKIKIPIEIYQKFNNLINMEYEINWIIGYCDKTVFQQGYYRSLEYNFKNYIEFVLPIDTQETVANFINSDNKDDIEKAIVVLYMMLLFIGGTN